MKYKHKKKNDKDFPSSEVVSWILLLPQKRKNQWREQKIIMAHVNWKRHVNKYVFNEFQIVFFKIRCKDEISNTSICMTGWVVTGDEQMTRF